MAINIGDPLLLSNAVRVLDGTTLFRQDFLPQDNGSPRVDLSYQTKWHPGGASNWSQFADGSGAIVGNTLNQEIEFYPTTVGTQMMPSMQPSSSPGPQGPQTIQPRLLTAAELSFLNTRPQLSRLRWLSGMYVTSPEGLALPAYFEWEAKVPHDQGNWPAFWLLPVDGNWPDLEIDTYEGFNDNDGNRRYTTSVHSNDSTWRQKVLNAGGATYVSDNVFENASATQDLSVGFDTATGFHRYGTLIYADFTYTVVDRVIKWKWPTPSTAIGVRLYMLHNFAIGGQADFAGTPAPGQNTADPMIVSDVGAWRMPATYGGSVVPPPPPPTPGPTPTPTPVPPPPTPTPTPSPTPTPTPIPVPLPTPTPTPTPTPSPTPVPVPTPIPTAPSPTPIPQPIPTPVPIPPPPPPIASTTYDIAEVGTYTGTDARLYRIQIGTAIWFYTNADRDIVWNGVTWSHIQISDDGIKQKGDAQSDDFTISVESTIPLVALYNGTPPTNPVQIMLFQLQYGDNIAPIMWTGYLSSVRYRDNVSADLVCNTQAALLVRKGLRLSWSRACPHALYDQACGLDRLAWGEEATITALASNAFDFTLTADSGRWENRFRNGYVEWAPDGFYTHRRPIMDHNGNNALISGMTDGMSIGMVVTLYPGCERTPTACKLFDNLSNYGGFPMMPGRSPFDGNPVF